MEARNAGLEVTFSLHTASRINSVTFIPDLQHVVATLLVSGSGLGTQSWPLRAGPRPKAVALSAARVIMSIDGSRAWRRLAGRLVGVPLVAPWP